MRGRMQWQGAGMIPSVGCHEIPHMLRMILPPHRLTAREQTELRPREPLPLLKLFLSGILSLETNTVQTYLNRPI